MFVLHYIKYRCCLGTCLVKKRKNCVKNLPVPCALMIVLVVPGCYQTKTLITNIVDLVCCTVKDN